MQNIKNLFTNYTMTTAAGRKRLVPKRLLIPKILHTIYGLNIDQQIYLFTEYFQAPRINQQFLMP